MNARSVAKNMSVAFTAQGISLMLAVFQSLVVPKLLGVEQYGYWQLFIFYSGYVGFFHLGLNDGVYLLKGGQGRDTIDFSSVKSQFVVAVSFQAALALIVVLSSQCFALPSERLFVIASTGVFLVIQNAAYYFMYVLQAMNETRKSSYSTIVNRLTFFVPLIVLLLARNDSFRPFIIAYIVSAAMQLAYCLFHCSDILCASFEGWRRAILESVGSVRVGSKLMVANIASQLILGVLRAIIDVAWGIETFGKLSFSLSLVNFFLAFVSQAAMVLFPALRQSTEKEIRRFYRAARDALGIAFPGIYLLYFPLVWLLRMWLPAYADSFHYFTWLIPICVFDSKMNITCTTLFKVRRREGTLLKINLATTAVCATMVGLSVYGLHSVEAAIASATLSIIGRSMLSEWIVSRDIDVRLDDVTLWEVGLTVCFIALAMMAPTSLAVVAYALVYLIFLMIHRDIVKEFTVLYRRQS